MKKTLLLFCLYLLSQTSNSQNITHNDAFFFGNIKDDYAHCITVDTKGNSITGGSYDSITTISGADSTASYNGHDAILFKQDSNGSIVWSKTFGAPGIDQVTAITTDDQDNIYIGVRSSGQLVLGADTVGWAWYEDPFIAKLDASGNFIWAKSFKSAASHTYIKNIKIASNGDIFAVGQFKDSMAVHGNTLIGDYYDGFVAQFDNTGEYKSLTHIEGPDYDVALDIVLTNDKGFIITGQFKDTINFDTTFLYNSQGSFYGYIAKYDSSSICSWAKNIYGATPEIDIDEHENLIVNVGKFVRKYNKNGSQLWSTNFSHVRDIVGVNFNNKNEIFAYGGFGTFSVSTDTILIDTTQLISKGNVDFFISKLDSSGNILWTGSYGGSEYDVLNDLAIFKENKIYGVGVYKSPTLSIGSFSGTNINISTYDGYTFNFDLETFPLLTTNIGELKLTTDITLYPNPTNGIINISSNEKFTSVRISTITGKLVHSTAFTKTIDISNYEKGVYFMSFITENGKSITKQIIKN